jgi:hypothetical protein
VNNPLNLAREGDKINYDRNEYINWQGLFAQAEYKWNGLSAFVSGSLSLTQNQRRDRFVFDREKESEYTPVVNVLGYNAKIGANYNITDKHNVFINTGVYSRAPYISFLFVGDRHDVAKDAANETVWGLEGGYGFNNRFLIIRADAYLTLWKDKQLLGRRTYLPDGSLIQPRLNGLGATHYGLELEVAVKPVRQVKLTSAFSIGSWTWQNNVIGTTYNDNTNTTDTLYVMADGLKVGNAPQLSCILGATWEPLKNLKLGLDFFAYGWFYANFDVSTRNNPEDRAQPLQLPSYWLMDVNASYTFRLWKVRPTLRANMHNLFNRQYISDANDGKQHDMGTSTFYYGFGRTYSLALEVRF